MKSNLLFLLLLLGATQCTTSSTENNSALQDKYVAPLQDTVNDISMLGKDPISLENTVELCVLLLEENKLQDLARASGHGGVFVSDSLSPKDGKIAVRFWYCYNTTDPNLPKFFLASEHIDKYDQNHPENMYSPNDEFIVSEPFVFDKPDIEPETIEKLIREHTAVNTLTQTKTINKTEVQNFSANFKFFMAGISPGGSKRPYCKYAVAVFKYDEPGFREFFTDLPTPKWVRYYFGLARDPSHKPNYLRPVLVGVDEHGTTITAKSRQDEPFLQKSVPPPPFN